MLPFPINCNFQKEFLILFISFAPVCFVGSYTCVICTSPTEILVWKVMSVLYILTGDAARIEIISVEKCHVLVYVSLENQSLFLPSEPS